LEFCDLGCVLWFCFLEWVVGVVVRILIFPL
jgi:hypothetical protein